MKKQDKMTRSVIDALLFAFLISLLVYAYKNTYRYAALHNTSLIHELDRTFADQLYSAQRQARLIKSLVEQFGNKHADIVEKIDKTLITLQDIEVKYSKNSPGLLFLGPIGTASIILKEQELEKKLLATINKLGSLVQPIISQAAPYTPATTIDAALQINQEYLGYLLKVTSVVP